MTMRILSIDGGGIRGLLAATVIEAYEAVTMAPAWRQFDLIAGTSTGGILAATPYLWVLALLLLPAFRHCLHRHRVTACVVYGSLAAMVVMTVVDCEMAGVLYRYLMDYSPVLLLGAALCWFCAEGALSRRAALGEGTAAAALPVLRTVMAAAAAYTAVYRFCTLFAMEPYLQGMNPSLYYTVSRLVQFWM